MPNESDTTTAPVTATSATEKPHVLADALPPDALKARLEQARAAAVNDLLKTLGVESADQIKAALATSRAAEDAKKSDAERLAAQMAEAGTLRGQVTALAKLVASQWTAEATRLTPAQVEAVNAIAGEDPARRLETLSALRPTWDRLAPAAPAPPPANTAPSANAPPTSTSPSGLDHKAIYDQLATQNPILGARYLAAHAREIYPEV